MRGGLVGGICFLAFLLSSGIKGENELSSEDHLDDADSRSSAIAIASAGDSLGGENNGFKSLYNPYYPSSSGAVAIAHALSDADDNNYPYSGEGNAFANALSNAGSISPYGHVYWKSDEPETETDNSGSDVDQAVPSNEHLVYSRHDSDNLALETQANINSRYDSDEDDNAQGRRSPGGRSILLAGAVSRVVSPNEYIIPSTIPGAENLVTCQAENEFHRIRTVDYNCLVCVCIREGWYLRAVCTSCGSCLEPPQPMPIPPSPFIPPPPPPQPESQVSCAPLPEDVPFQNPLNPCQICICERTFNVFGQLDVQIQCKEDPQCDLLPPAPSPLPDIVPPVPPPMPEVFPPVPSPLPNILPPTPAPLSDMLPLVPSPLPELLPYIEPSPSTPAPLPPPPPEPTDIEPIPWPPIVPMRPKPKSPLPGPPPHETCQPYPPDQPFQHPWDECQICVCSEIYGANVVNIEVNCYTKPSCCVEPPIPEPLALPSPYNANPSQIITLDPICEYQSLNVDFVHPVDMCQICDCQMFGNMIIPVCRPTNEPGCNVGPGKQVYGDVVYIEPKCSNRLPYESFIVDCQVCSCQVVFQYVISRCNLIPNCGNQYYPSIGSGNGANYLGKSLAQSSTLKSPSIGLELANSQPQGLDQVRFPQPILPSPMSQTSAVAQAQSQAISDLYSSLGSSSAEALANAQTNSLSPYSNSYPYSSGGQSSAQAQAEAIAEAQTAGLGGIYGNYPYYPRGSGQSSAQAQAEAIANAQSSGLGGLYGGDNLSSAQAQVKAVGNAQYAGLGDLYGNYPYYPGGSKQSSAQAQAEVIANAQAAGLGGLYGSNSLSNAQAQAEAVANAQNVGLGDIYGNYPYYPGSSKQSSAQVQAEAIANAQTAGLGGLYGIDSLSNAQAQAEAVGNAPNAGLSGLYGNYPYLPGGSKQSSAQAQTEAIANAQTSGLGGLYGSNSLSNAQAQETLANAQIAGLSGLYGNYPYYLGGSKQSSAQAEAIANAQAAGLGGLYGGDSLSSAQAQAEAVANAQAAGLGGLYGNYPYYPGGSSQSSAQAQAEAMANSQSAGLGGLYRDDNLSNGQAQAKAVANSQSERLSGLYGNYPYYPGGSQLSSAQAQAEAIANAQNSGLGGLYGNNPYYTGGSSQSRAQAQADAIANAQLSGLPQYNNAYPYSYGGQSNAQAQAEALANAQGGQSSVQGLANAKSSNLFGPYSSYPYYPSSSQASALADANAVAASLLYPSMYPRPSSTVTGLYQPGFQQRDSSSLAQAQAVAQAQGQAAQSLAKTSAISGRPLIRSGAGLCKYDGDKYHHNCQACYCFSEANGSLYTLCLGNPCA